MSFVLRNHDAIAGLKELQYFGEFCDPHLPLQDLAQAEIERISARLIARQDKGILSDRPQEKHYVKAREFAARFDNQCVNHAVLFAELLQLMAAEQGKTIPCEQTPRNIFYAQRILDFYPQARVVHMVRDPRAVMASQKQRWQRRKLAKSKENFPLFATLRAWANYHPFTIARLWNRASQIAVRMEAHERVLLVRFEDLLRDPEHTIKSVCKHCGIDYQPEMLSIDQINSSHNTAGGDAKKGFNVATIDVWKKVLDPAEVAIVEHRCGAGIERFDYPREMDAGTSRSKARSIRHVLSYAVHAVGVLLLNPKRAWIQLRALLRPLDDGKATRG